MLISLPGFSSSSTQLAGSAGSWKTISGCFDFHFAIAFSTSSRVPNVERLSENAIRDSSASYFRPPTVYTKSIFRRNFSLFFRLRSRYSICSNVPGALTQFCDAAIIRRARRNAGLTQTDLGKRIGLRQATISRLEKGEEETKLSTLLDALSALGLEIIIDKRGRASTW
ncbi:MAG: helix-turn-helix transcriptional regulator, partial [Proteobacteria bacterium]|nr:helix-turn-helix transcriptional regulator [Pseudomonadota bacterium]